LNIIFFIQKNKNNIDYYFVNAVLEIEMPIGTEPLFLTICQINSDLLLGPSERSERGVFKNFFVDNLWITLDKEIP
jgi:hypothetical protein